MKPSPSTDYRRWCIYRELRLLDGTWEPFTDPAPTQAHITHLRSQGLSVRAIARMAGVPLSTLSPIAWPEHVTSRVKIRHATEAAVLAVRFDLDHIPGEAFIPATGTRRRLQALAAAGWTMGWVAEQLGVSLAMVSDTALNSEQVTAARARQIRDIFNAHAYKPGPSDLCRRRSIGKGWAPAAAWDDIDDPTENPRGIRRSVELQEA